VIAQVILNGFVSGATIALMAIGFTLIFGILRIVNFSHGVLYMLGAVIVFYVVVLGGIPYVLASIVAIVTIGLAGWLTDRFIVRRLHGNLMGGAIATLALMLGLENIMWLIWGPLARGVPSIVTGKVEIFGAIMSAERLVICGVSFVVILGLAYFIKRSRMGKSMRAVQQDSEAALTVGINVNRVCAVTFAMAAGLAALVGALVAPVYSVHPAMGTHALFFAFIVVILGGLGSVMGAFIASFIIGFQQSVTISFGYPEFAMAISFGLAMVILFFLPRGLMGHD